MPSLSLLVATLKKRYPDFSFTEAEHFSWSPTEQAILYNASEPNAPLLLLHELSHALLKHSKYRRDVELIAMETAAWEKARALTAEFEISYDEDVAQDHLDTYREWLHARSTCPNCSANGYQIEAFRYECPACTHSWRVNEARVCALRRYSNK